MKSIFFHIFDLILSDLYVVWEIYLMNKQTQVSSKTTVYILANIPYFFPSPQKWNTLFLPWFWHPKLCFDVDINISGWPNFSNKKFQNFCKNSKAHFSKIPRLRTEHHSVLPPKLSSAAGGEGDVRHQEVPGGEALENLTILHLFNTWKYYFHHS